MTRDDILQMKPGRKLDALVHEKIFGKEVQWRKTPTTKYPIGVPFYSTNIADAWLVVEKMIGKWADYTISSHEFGSKWLVTWGFDGYGWQTVVESPTASVAICKAALLAVMEV